MFTIYHSNQLDLLKSLLVELIRQNPLENPFDAEQILVQSPGMSQWLKMELAESFGVAANIEFPLPATFIWRMFTQVLDDVPTRSYFNKEAMTWKLMSILPEQFDRPEFQPLQRYLENDNTDLKRYQLAEKIADIFDQYLVYRPEWIDQWEAGKVVEELGDEHPWQPILWQALYKHTTETLGQSPYHRANLYDDFICALKNGASLPSSMPKRLFVFGISSLPKRYLDALVAIGEHIDVHLMFTNPCQYYWGDIRDRKTLAKMAARKRKEERKKAQLNFTYEDLLTPTYYLSPSDQKKGIELTQLSESELSIEDDNEEVGNGLLASMGKLGRDNLHLLSDLSVQEIDAFVDIPQDTLLHSIQNDILNLQDRQSHNSETLESSDHKHPIKTQDHSIQLHGCHTPTRELEVLYDQLLAMFERDPSLKPRDVIVMVADINAYSAAVQAVFGNVPNRRYIPFSISDRTADQENPILLAFLRLFQLPNSRCTASELLELLEVPAVLSKFGFDDKSFEKIKRWVEESGIRWGLDPNTAGEFQLPQQNQNTWLFGISRMLLGYAMPSTAGLFNGMSAYDQVQGLDAQLAGQLAQFVDLLLDYRTQLMTPKSVQEWMTVLNTLLDDFFEVELEGELVLKSIRDLLVRLQEQLTDAAHDDVISPDVLYQYVQDKLSNERVSQRFLAGQVNFCTLMPMRSIPFKVVCLLGMNNGAYPRNIAPEGFDLMNKRMRRGDRSRRDDDRYLFLEALLSAQETLYISYVSNSIKDNSTKVPSVLVSELLEYCQQNCCLENDKTIGSDKSGRRLTDSLTHYHPLVPFSALAFKKRDDEVDNRSYASEWYEVAQRQGTPPLGFLSTPLTAEVRADNEVTVLELSELQRFWRLPVQYFFQRCLKVNFELGLGVPEDDEPFALNGLENYGLLDSLLNVLLTTDGTDKAIQTCLHQFSQEQRAMGRLPVAVFGDLVLKQTTEKARALLAQLQGLAIDSQDDMEVDVVVNDRIRLQGWIKHRYGCGLLRYRVGALRPQDILTAWLDHLCLAVMAPSEVTHFISMDKTSVCYMTFPTIDAVDANVHLALLIAEYERGLLLPLPYFPKTAYAGLKKPDSSLTAMKDVFNDGFKHTGEGQSAYISRVWSEWEDELGLEVEALALRVLQPALDSMIEMDITV